MLITPRSEDDEIVKVETPDPYENEDGYFNASTRAVVQDNDDDIDSYICVVTFDGYSQNLTTEITSASCRGYFDYRLVLLNTFVLYLLANLNIFI